MSRRYKGINNLANIISEVPQSCIEIKLDTKNINFFNKLIESYENLALVIPINPQKGLLRIHTTPDLYEELWQVLKSVPMEIEVKKIAPFEAEKYGYK